MVDPFLHEPGELFQPALDVPHLLLLRGLGDGQGLEFPMQGLEDLGDPLRIFDGAHDPDPVLTKGESTGPTLRTSSAIRWADAEI